MSTPASVRIPGPLRERIAATAEVERRSFSNQIVVLLEEAFARRESGVSVPSAGVGRAFRGPDPKVKS